MARCDRCDTVFSPSAVREEFNSEYPSFDYDGFKEKLCFDCAKDVIESEEDGDIELDCEECGKTFDPFADMGDFIYQTGDSGPDYLDTWSTAHKRLCLDCAMDEQRDFYS